MQLGKALPHPNSNGRDRSGGILALLTSSLLLAAGAALARPDCADWNTVQFFKEATAADVGRCISQGADPKARADGGVIPVELVPDDSPLRGTDVYWRLNEGRYR